MQVANLKSQVFRRNFQSQVNKAKTHANENKQRPIKRCEAQLLENAYSRHFCVVLKIWASKVGQTDLVLGVPSGFISSSVRVRLQVFVCSSGYKLTVVDNSSDFLPREHMRGRS